MRLKAPTVRLDVYNCWYSDTRLFEKKAGPLVSQPIAASAGSQQVKILSKVSSSRELTTTISSDANYEAELQLIPVCWGWDKSSKTSGQ